MDPDPGYSYAPQTLEVRVRRQCETPWLWRASWKTIQRLRGCIIPVWHPIQTIGWLANDARLWGHAGV